MVLIEDGTSIDFLSSVLEEAWEINEAVRLSALDVEHPALTISPVMIDLGMEILDILGYYVVIRRTFPLDTYIFQRPLRMCDVPPQTVNPLLAGIFINNFVRQSELVRSLVECMNMAANSQCDECPHRLNVWFLTAYEKWVAKNVAKGREPISLVELRAAASTALNCDVHTTYNLEDFDALHAEVRPVVWTETVTSEDADAVIIKLAPPG